MVCISRLLTVRTGHIIWGTQCKIKTPCLKVFNSLKMRIKPVNPKGNQSWICIGRTDAEAEAPIFWPADEKSIRKDPVNEHAFTWMLLWTCIYIYHWKRPSCWGRLKAGEEGGNRGWDGWMASLTPQTEFEQIQGDSEGQASLECCSPWGLKDTQLSDWTTSKIRN